MSETTDPPKKQKAKKRPSDFEIMRTILQRSHERKLPYIMRHLGEDPDLLFLCSQGEGGLTYGSPDVAIALFEWTSDEMKAVADAVMPKIVGFMSDECTSTIINIREQFSLLSKTKGEKIDLELSTNGGGTCWYTRAAEKQEDRAVYLAKDIDSLYHARQVETWCKAYRHLLSTDQPDYLYYTYAHPEGRTGEVLTLTPPDPAHPMGVLYPHGFRAMVTRGRDVILDKFLLELPFPVIKQELIVFQIGPGTAQIAHRLVADGWRMILLRPHAVMFPTSHIPLKDTGLHLL